jgi:folate-dependent phosphoribosylglycinamide formyltransferase PurN
MMHLVTPELDSGPVITYCTYPITGNPFDNYWRALNSLPIAQIKKEQGENYALFQLIRRHGLAREFPLIVSTIKAFGQGEVKIEAGKLIDRKGKPISGYNLTDEVNRGIGSL